MRFILLHHHIFKNAGASLDAALRRYFGQRFIDFHPSGQDNGRIYKRQLLSLLDSRPDIEAISSHHFLGKDFRALLSQEEIERFVFHDLSLIRHPIKRLISVYLYYRTIGPGPHPVQNIANTYSVQDFIAALLDKHPNFVINPQVTIFGCDQYGAAPSRRNLDIATNRIIKMTMIGTVERYHEAMTVAEYMMQPIYSSIALHGRRENRSDQGALDGYDGSLSSIRRIIGDELYDIVFRINELDIKLWISASKELDYRIQHVPNFKMRLNDFLRRCSLSPGEMTNDH